MKMTQDDLDEIKSHLDDSLDRWNIILIRNDLEKAVEEISRLRKEIKHYSDLYYSEISLPIDLETEELKK